MRSEATSAPGKETQRPRPAAWSGSCATEQARVHSRRARLVLTPLLTRSALPRVSNSRTLKSRSSGSSPVERLPRCSAGCGNSCLRTPGNASLTRGSTAVPVRPGPRIPPPPPQPQDPTTTTNKQTLSRRRISTSRRPLHTGGNEGRPEI